jgi:peptidoglycan-associated lipoprotein
VVTFSIVGCKKKVTPPPPPPPPPVVTPAPTAQITGTPNVITAGNSVSLNWSTTNATSASITGLGDVPTSGIRTVTPPSSTVYTLTAKGPGGSTSASVRITVNPLPPQAPPPRSLTAEEEFRANVQDIFFDYDKASVRPEAMTTLTQDAAYFNSHPNLKIVIGGYCDERGSAEYNVALGEDRAQAAKKALVNDGVDASRLRVVSYGKEKPFCTESTEECWQKNRRAGFSIDH